MTKHGGKPSIVYTNKARCRDCYKCLRACPVKAIRMSGSQAMVDAVRCISCGQCINACPQHAKAYRSDIELIYSCMTRGERVAVSLAPSFSAAYEPENWYRLPSALRKLGVSHVSETAIGAGLVSSEISEYLNSDTGNWRIEASCPAAVSYIEKYIPVHRDKLIPVVSPMIAHARLLKKELGADIRVVFVGPCVAKKAEAAREEYRGIIDAVLTFEELNQLLDDADIKLHTLEESGFDWLPLQRTRNYPLPGGALSSAGLEVPPFSDRSYTLAGFRQLKELAETDKTGTCRSLEALFCRGGCITGPVSGTSSGEMLLRNRLIHYNETAPVSDDPDQFSLDCSVLHQRACGQAVIAHRRISEDDIRGELEKTGKLDTENQLNCGACGYDTCLEKAKAVLAGMAESEMCVPYMKALAEKRTDRIIETSPNGIVILNEEMEITSINPAFKKMFFCGDAIIGRPISYLVDSQPFEQLLSGREARVERVVEYPNYQTTCHLIAYRLREEGRIVGIFVNISELKEKESQIERIRAEAKAQARELLQHQMKMAQDMTRFLGESTVKGEALVEKMMQLVNSRDE